GGEGSGKSTQAAILTEWLTDRDYDAILTHQPGGTEIGREIRELVLHRPRDYMAPRTEALLYAADKAEHVDTVIRPALDRGAAVITDRYIDSALAYQGGGRELEVAEVRLVSRWATGGLRPHLTVLLDIPPEVGLARIDGDSDRLEQESLDFHETVRQHFLDLAALDPDRYVVVDATQGTMEIAARIRASVEPMLSAVHRRTPTSERT
ncbi:MAG TPA: dTMP kinase, partial [Actinopolymorphaceae bacterium]